MLAILALYVSACGSIENTENDSNLNVDSTTNIREHDSIPGAQQESDSVLVSKAAMLLPETAHISQ